MPSTGDGMPSVGEGTLPPAVLLGPLVTLAGMLLSSVPVAAVGPVVVTLLLLLSAPVLAPEPEAGIKPRKGKDGVF